MKKCNIQRGFSLLETLISVLVLTVGLSGVVLLQSKSVRYNQAAHLRSIALSQAENMIERMRSNSTAMDNGNYNAVSGIPANPSCTSCTEAEMAQKDAYYWNTLNGILLPSGQGTVVNNGTQFTVTVYWDGARTGATGTGCSGNTSVDLSCIVMEFQ